jgi:DNA topoisomerase IB
MLKKRKKEAGENGDIFPKTNDGALLEYAHTLDGGNFKVKDFRTHHGTATALEEVAKMPKPANEKEYKKAVMAVAKIVAQKLGNTPTIALQSYISPTVFADWRM